MYTRYAGMFDMLSDKDTKRLLLAVFRYVEQGDATNFEKDAGLNMAFAVIKADLDRDAEKWAEAKRKMSEAGKKGMATRWGASDDNPP